MGSGMLFYEKKINQKNHFINEIYEQREQNTERVIMID
jgi:hypothetical protein